MKNKLTLVGGIAVASALILAPLAAANGDGSGGSGHSSVGVGFFKQPVVPEMQLGSTMIAVTPTVAKPATVEATPFASPTIKAGGK